MDCFTRHVFESIESIDVLEYWLRLGSYTLGDGLHGRLVSIDNNNSDPVPIH